MIETRDIIATLRTALPELRQQWPIRKLALFGSRVRDDARPDCDLDVLVGSVDLSHFRRFSPWRRDLQSSPGYGPISLPQLHSSLTWANG
jgi:predicted nucleotidyltransferase